MFRENKIHTTFKQLGASTGRISSLNPNLQNIPVRSELGAQLRSVFIPSSKDKKFLSADYSQIELRVLAHVANDDAMIQAFKKGEDIHATTAMSLFDIDDNSQVTKEQRRIAKAVNFGIAYGQSAFGLSRTLQVSVVEAKDIIKKYFQRFPEIKNYIVTALERARKDGYIQTLFNRQRDIPELNSSKRNFQQFGERIAINSPIQGTAADIIKIAMIEIAQILKNYRSEMILQIHDELIFEVYPDEVILLEEEIKRTMENVVNLKTKLIVNVSIGDNWGEI